MKEERNIVVPRKDVKRCVDRFQVVTAGKSGEGRENGKLYRGEIYSVILRTLHIEPVIRECAFTDVVHRLARVHAGIVHSDRLEAQLGTPYRIVQQHRSPLYQRRRRRRRGVGQRCAQRYRVFEPLDTRAWISVRQALQAEEGHRVLRSGRERRTHLESRFRYI